MGEILRFFEHVGVSLLREGTYYSRRGRRRTRARLALRFSRENYGASNERREQRFSARRPHRSRSRDADFPRYSKTQPLVHRGSYFSLLLRTLMERFVVFLTISDNDRVYNQKYHFYSQFYYSTGNDDHNITVLVIITLHGDNFVKITFTTKLL